MISTDLQIHSNINPAIGDQWIVWEDNSNQSIIAYNYQTGVEITLRKTLSFAKEPGISGDRVVWYEWDGVGTYDIYYTDLDSYDGTTNRLPLTGVSQKIHPAVSGNKIVWENVTAGHSDVDMFDLTGGNWHILTPGTGDSDQTWPSIGSDRVVWLDKRMNAEGDIYMIDTGSPPPWPTTEIFNGGGLTQFPPVINSDLIAWSGDSGGGSFDIFKYDLSVGGPAQQVTVAGSNKISPAVCSTYLIWMDDQIVGDPNYDLAFFDSSLPPELIITTTSSLVRNSIPPDWKPGLNSDNHIIWQDDRGAPTQIYMYTYGTVVSCPAALYTENITSGAPPLAVQFTDASTNSPTHWLWKFGDGTTSTAQSPAHTFSTGGTYDVELTAGSPHCRNTTTGALVHRISVGAAPIPSIIGSPREGIAPLTVVFNGSATGAPTGWAWDFGDLGTSTNQNHTYIYNTPGRYSVSLTATNIYGPGVTTEPNYIIVKAGAHSLATTNIAGLTASTIGSNQQITINSGAIPSVNPDPTILITRPPDVFGWQNLTLVSDSDGFSFTAPNYIGNITHVILQIKDLTPTGFPAEIGSNLPVNYEMHHNRYTIPAMLYSEIWNGTIPTDNTNFENIIQGSGFSSKNVAYTLNTTRSGITAPSHAFVNMSVASDWVQGSTSLPDGRDKTFVIMMGWDTCDKLWGTVLKPVFVGHDGVNNLEFFEVEIPSQISYMSKFALAKLSGSGNVFQMAYLGATDHSGASQQSAGSESGADTGDGKSTGQGLGSQQNQPSQNQPEANPAAPTAKSADLYINDQGVVTQTTVLESADQFATIAIGQGVTAFDSGGNPLSSVSIETLSVHHIFGMPSPNTLSFAGLAYNFQPDGATFSPSVTITFTPPNAQWSQQYTISQFDAKSGSWIDLPTTYDTKSGTVSTSVSHFCCIALFSSAIPSKVPVTASVTMEVPPETIPTPSPSSPLGIFYNMVIFIAGIAVKNLYLILIIIAIIAILYLKGRRGRLDKIRYKL
ncbi:MAG: PKD domain-containing protein [Methanoregula sp.]|nr:MAG: PKD domain-containing protein [Methanoregula sp.]